MTEQDYTNLSAGYSQEQADAVRDIIEGRVDPKTYQSVKQWVNDCYNVPADYELKMCAINEILGNYGTEALTGNWQNGHWCDIVAIYSNTGDSYAYTVAYHRDHGFMVCGWADVIERFPEDFDETNN